MNKLLAITLLFAANAHAYEIVGKVIGVTDGDTVKILDDTYQQYKIRLADIDAPESGQPFGNRAKQFLSSLVFGKQVKAICREKDRYKRDVCSIYTTEYDVNASLVRYGYAWVYHKYNKRDDLVEYEALARAEKQGLWALPEAQIVEPSKWRKGQRGVQQQVQQAFVMQSASSDYTCGSKRYCKQMSSCAEAKFYLTQCGVGRLDGDKDGIPCESICR